MTEEQGLRISPRIVIPPREIQLSYARSSGPGGQNVNKVSSKAVLRFSLRDSPSLPAAARARALGRLASRLTRDGDVVLSSSAHREQSRNREAVLRRFRDMLAAAVATPKRRVPTKPSAGSRERRITGKKARSRLKTNRARPAED